MSEIRSTTLTSADTGAFHYVDWGAIVAGTVLASGISIVLFTFGSAIGLSMVSPYQGEGASKTAYFVALGLWSLWVVASSFMAGGYVAGRLRRRVGDSTEHESDVRDGVHGLTVWALGVLVASLLLAAGVSGAVGSAARFAASDTQADERMGFTVDSLFRGAGESTSSNDNEAERGEVGRILTYGVTRGELAPAYRMYLSRLVAARTGLDQVNAEQRVDEVMAEARRTADTARKAGIIIAFLTAAALLVGGAAAAWAATLGGKHRDQNTDHSTFWRWR